MEEFDILLTLIVFLIILTLGLFFISKLRRSFRSHSLEVQTIPHPFEFRESTDAELKESIIKAINRMGGVGENAEEEYQKILAELRPRAEEIIPIVYDEYQQIAEEAYLDRWSLVMLMSELKAKTAIKAFDEILSTRIPPERYEQGHTYSSKGEEIMIRMTAIDGVVGLATSNMDEEDQYAWEVLLKHVQHEDFTLKQIVIHSYLLLGGENALSILLDMLPKEDHYLLEIEDLDYEDILLPESNLIRNLDKFEDSHKSEIDLPPPLDLNNNEVIQSPERK